MVKNLLNKKRMKKGFTLIELIIVMAVIAILAAIAVPQYLEIKEKSKVKSDVASAKLIYDSAKQLAIDDSIGAGTYSIKTSTPTGGNDSEKGILNGVDETNIWPKSKNFKTQKEFKVQIDTDGKIIVSIVRNDGTTENIAYPDDNVGTNILSTQYKGKYRD